MAILQFQLFHFAGAPRFSKSPPGEMTAFLGKETKVQCDFLGNPTPEVTWTRSPAKPLPQGRSKVKKEGLYISTALKEKTEVFTRALPGTIMELKFMALFLKSNQ